MTTTPNKLVTWLIVPLDQEDADAIEELEVLAVVEATGKMEAMRIAARGLGGHVSHFKSYQQSKPMIFFSDWQGNGPMQAVARRRRGWQEDPSHFGGAW